MYFSKHHNRFVAKPNLYQNNTKIEQKSNINIGAGVSVASEKIDDKQRVPLENLIEKLKIINIKK